MTPLRELPDPDDTRRAARWPLRQAPRQGPPKWPARRRRGLDAPAFLHTVLRNLAAACLALLLLAGGPSHLAMAAVSDPAELLRDPAQEERARSIGRELRCMVCQNQSIEDSDADLARDLRRIVREQVTAGRSDRQIVDFLHDRYGDFVLLRPPFKAATLLLWGAPAIALGIGFALIVAMRRRRAPAAPTELSAAERARLAKIEGGQIP